MNGERFSREIRVAARLTHPHIVALYDSGEAAGLPYYVMAYVEGESLRHRLEKEGRLPLDAALGIVLFDDPRFQRLIYRLDRRSQAFQAEES
jgi:serine/threonine-protein kinase